ncbi:TerD family protein [Actinomadura sp. WMMB 499]|uniref:TerD family protein n=1 Tax=Actinomadura sp. WMMB 499 TaxID=1219491 RepID=UPI0012446CD9|nr:TerD family protein [Actinomadura sp. WMMB 499]QFG21460.1 TerD family protein [Actinomadura sp. WMMB 499]
MTTTIERLVVRHTHRVPVPDGPAGAGDAAARRFDAALMSAGFKLSGDLLAALSRLDSDAVSDLAARVLPVVREIVGDHVRHNVYFRDFPHGVPDTLDFWVSSLVSALADPDADVEIVGGSINLLSLPKYGKYLHSYEEMLAAHDELVAGADRVTVLHAGDATAAEADRLFLALAGSVTPLTAAELEALRELAAHCTTVTPEAIPVRENRALINQVRVAAGGDLLLDTVTDVLRLACGLSLGDVTLAEPTEFLLTRRERRALLAGLDAVVGGNPAKLGDVAAHRERWKRLGERLHPHEYPRWPHARDVFAVARGEKKVPSFAGRVEALLGGGDVAGAANLAANAPGTLFRSLDRLLRTDPSASGAVLDAAESVAGRVSGRVLLSVREHLLNRTRKAKGTRVFASASGRGVAVPDTRPPLDPDAFRRLKNLLDAELASRLPAPAHLVVDPAVLDVALPLSGKATADGLGVLPRGSLSPVDGELLRFFIYWKQREYTTDFDLSALMLDKDYDHPEWLSYTSLRKAGGRHSGDITEAPDGASEFIDLSLRKIKARFVIPQVNIYSGEGFDEVEESFFGFMLRDAEQGGRPFEPKTVRMKSDLRGPARVSLPLAFVRGKDGDWRAKWMHLHVRGGFAFNRVENNRVTTAGLTRAVIERRYLTVRHLVDLMRPEQFTMLDGVPVPGEPVTFVGLDRPEGLHPDSTVVTLKNLRDLIPA